MKISKTGIKELTARYRDILRKCAYLNAIILMSAMAAPAMATDVSTAAELKTALEVGSDATVAGDIADIGLISVSGKTNTLDVAGNTLSGATTGDTGFSFTGSSSTTLTGGGTISGFSRPDVTPQQVKGDEYGVLNIGTGSNLTVTGGNWNFSGNTSALGAINSTNGSVDMEVSKIAFENNLSNAQGAGFRHDVSDAAYNDTYARIIADEIKFKGNSFIDDPSVVVGSGAGAMNSRGTMELLGANNIFENNNMNAHVSESRAYKVGGGAVANQSGENAGTVFDATMVIGTDNSVNTFTGNHSSTNGGAIMNRAVDDDGDATLTIKGTTTFKNNSADMNGGAIYNIAQNGHTAKVDLANTTFAENTATENGGAVYNSGKVTASRGTFSGNTATKQGGAIFNAGNMDLNGTFSENTAGTMGGAIYMNTKLADGTQSGGVANISNSQFTKNSATGEGSIGGAIFLHDGEMHISDTTFDSNEADYGGAIYTSSRNTVSLDIKDSTFKNNTAKGSGALGAMTNVSVSNTKFLNNHATEDEDGGGAVFVGAVANAQFSSSSLTDLAFDGNTSATRGGAISTRGTNANNSGAKLDILNASFSNNTAGTTGGAIDNYLYGSSNQTGSVYVVESILSNNTANQGGAVYNHGEKDAAGNFGNMMFVDSNFTDNTATENGGAVHNSGTFTAENSTFTGNKAVGTMNTGGKGGALYNEGVMTLVDSELSDNDAGFWGGAIYNGNEMSIRDSQFSGNTAWQLGGAVYNYGTLNIDNSLFNGNEVSDEDGNIGLGGAINNGKTLVITDTDFINNTAGYAGGAILTAGEGSSTTIKAVTKDVLFSGNTAHGEANDIDVYRSTLNLNAGADRTISLKGGIADSDSEMKDQNIVNINDGTTGTVDISGSIINQTVTVKGGELHLSNGKADGSNLSGSTVTVNNGATINTIDDMINNYTSQIALNTGAVVKGDVDFMNESADTYAAADGASSIKYALGNLIGSVGKGSKTIQVTADGVTVDASEAKFTSDNGASVTSTGTNDGSIIVKGFAGGLETAADESANVASIDYQLTEDEVISVEKSIQDNFVLNGAGVAADSKGVELADALNVADGADLTLNELKLTGTGALNNKSGATLRINDSQIKVNVNNAGVMYSDPTTYYGVVTNDAGATASFDGDTFASGSSLTNSGVVNLSGTMAFESGSTLTGNTGNVLNILNGTTAFGGTTSGNNVVLANGAKFTGTLTGGSLNTQNGVIDTITGVTSGTNLYLDANMKGSGTVDTLGSDSTGVIKSINLTASEYGTADSISLAVGNATLADDAEITGAMNYYTKVEKDGTNLVFSDKLVNQTLLKKTAAGADYDNSTSGLSADTIQAAIDENASNIADKQDQLVNDKTSPEDISATVKTTVAATASASDTKLVTEKAIASALDTKVNTADLANKSLDIDANSLKVKGDDVLTTASTLDGSKLTDGSVAKAALDTTVQASLDKADSAVQSITTGVTNGTIKVDGTEVSVAGLKSAAFVETTAFDAAGAADTALSSAKDYTNTRETAITSAYLAADATTLNSAKAYTDTREGIITTAYTAADATTLNSAKSYTDTREAAIKTAYGAADTATLNTAKAYTDTREGIITTAYTAADATTLSTAKGYTDTREAAIKTAYEAADTATLNSAKAYTDIRETAITTAITTAYTAADAVVLDTAKSYTDTREAAITSAYAAADTVVLNTAKGYTDTREAAITAAYEAADTATLNSAKSYTDTREAAIKTAYEAADAATLNSAKSYTDTREAAITSTLTTAYAAADAVVLDTAKDYTDTREAAITAAYEAADTATLNSAKAYTDTREAAITTAITSAYTAADAVVLDTAKGYTDTREAAITSAYTAADTATLNTAKGYTDTREAAITSAYTAADTATLNSAKSYTDTREAAITSAYTAADTATLNSAKGYTDTREAAITAAYTAADTITLNTAKDYTDTREVAITAAYTAADTDTLNSAKSYTDDATFMKTDGNNFNEGDSVISAIKSLDNASGDQSQFANSRYLDANMTSADAIMSLDRNLDSVDHRIRTMEKEMKGGFASVAALSALAPNARANGNTQIALGTGIYRDHQGLAIGAYHYFDDNILANIGASYAGDKSAMLRAGVTFGW